MSDVQNPSFMSFDNANTFSFDKFATPEAPGLLNGGTTWVDDLTARALSGNSSCYAGFLELPLRPTSESPLDWDCDWDGDAFTTLIGTSNSRITLAMCDCEAEQHTLPVDSFSNSNTDMQLTEMRIQAELTPLHAFGTTDSVCEDSGSDLSEISRSPVESWDTGASSRLNYRKPVDDREEDLQLAIFPTGTIVVPQKLYQPRGETERQKYVHTAKLSSPIFFYAEKPSELGISLEEILSKNSRRLSDRDDLVFEGGGRSISLRIEWPGYLSWNCQLPTRDYRKTPGPITKARLAKNLATCIRKFVREMTTHHMEAGADPMWRISPRRIKFEDLILVSLDHVSQGSWQPQLRVRRQVRGASSRA